MSFALAQLIKGMGQSQPGPGITWLGINAHTSEAGGFFIIILATIGIGFEGEPVRDHGVIWRIGEDSIEDGMAFLQLTGIAAISQGPTKPAP